MDLVNHNDQNEAMEVENTTLSNQVPTAHNNQFLLDPPALYVSSPRDDPDEDANFAASDTDRISVSSRERSPEYNADSCTQASAASENPKAPEEDEDEGTLCPICLDNWTNEGDHRICALKCGHLFGYKCVTRWLESQQKKSCPTCKKRVNRSDLRFIYAKKLIAVDTSEVEAMRAQLEDAVAEKNRVLQDITRYVSREHILNQEIGNLKKRIRELTGVERTDHRLTNTNYNHIVRLYMDKSMEICKQNGCRVFDANRDRNIIIVSMKSPTNLFSGFGIRKVNVTTYKQQIFFPLHDLQIRDISFHPTKNWVLSASMDKKCKVVDVSENNVLFTMSNNMPLWSCCWDANLENVLYFGTQGGAVIQYDVRNVSSPLSTLAVPGDMSPVVSVASIPSGMNSDIIHGGIISCKLNSLWIFENFGESHIRHSLPLEGPFVSMKYQPETKQLLVSSRPNNRITYARHTLCTLEKVREPESISCHIIHSFQGGGMQKLLSKSCFVSDRQEYVAAYHESNKTVHLWSINTGEKICSIPAHDTVLDLRGVRTTGGNFLVSLTEKRLEFFKFNTS